ncbi:MAG: DUF3272 family protein [Streptococcus sp.]|nr:DUF3272 family protein [Streptococcus sp.]
MNRRQFIMMVLMTSIETYFFNESLFSEHYFLALFLAFLIIRNLHVAYIMQRIASEIDKYTRGRNKQ